ncbi:MAG: hypothetical protein ACKVP4_02055 [Hyphomicrobium sp.]
MSRVATATIALGILALAAMPAAAADEIVPELPEPIACAAQADDPTIAEPEKSAWSDCEKWVWSCVRRGLEANMFSKQCLVPRQADTTAQRKKYRFAPFVTPDVYASSNALSDKFLIAVLTKPPYVAQVPPVGVRIFGAYFADPVNLENLTTVINLVLDASMARQGLRMTNFRTDKNLSIDGSNVRGPTFLMRARVEGSIFMEKSVVDSVDLNDARIGSSFEATGALFNGDLRMHRAYVAGKVILTKALLTTLNAWNSHFGSSLEMRLADIRKGLDLTGSTVDGDVRLPEVSFGRRIAADPLHCDWNPAARTEHILNLLKTLLPPDRFEAAWRETVELRDVKNGVPMPNACISDEPSAQPAVKENALLRDMTIKGTLCLVDVTGEIQTSDAAQPVAQSIATISLDGTQAKSTILSWKPSPSATEWRAVNFKTDYLLINLHSQPNVHYIDNLELGLITLLKSDATAVAAQAPKMSDEHLVKLKCDVKPGTQTTDVAGDRDTQDRLVRFFMSDQSGSAQPFSAIVASLDSTGVNTVHLKKALSALKYRNLCASSQMSQSSSNPAATLGERLTTVKASEAAKLALDGVCSMGLASYAALVSYGHEPHRLFYFTIGMIVLFWALLKLDGPPPAEAPAAASVRPAGHRFDVAYAIDNFNPLKTYRIDRERSEILPNKRWLRFYRACHRVVGSLFLVLILLIVYKIVR